ncbi:autoinhibited Ca(2+)-ATPase, putative [Medicago truncatula]|uniref:Autoinhibited Ca(2+)-ATPase, putative n=1 Tax=Medicago truncatula TaxID=3880 RepID=G7L1Y3_MEDTR|nr:autoinhibited Ca(2+)-ATPase, putative [Medicago truncatula]
MFPTASISAGNLYRSQNCRKLISQPKPQETYTAAKSSVFPVENSNEFNAPKQDEFNIFKGVTRNSLFMVIEGLTIVLQVSLVTNPL